MPTAVAVETRNQMLFLHNSPSKPLTHCPAVYCLPCTLSLTWGFFHSLLKSARASGGFRMPCVVQLLTACVHHFKICKWWSLNASDEERNWPQTLLPLGSMASLCPNKHRGTASNTSRKTLFLSEGYTQHSLAKKGGRIVTPSNISGNA